MLIDPQVRSKIDEITRRCAHLRQFLDIPGKQQEIARLEDQMSRPGFWDKAEQAQKTSTQVSRLKDAILPVLRFTREVDDLSAMIELLGEMSDDEGAPYAKELEQTVARLAVELEEAEIGSFLTGPHDANNALLSIHAGAGGTEACDWADMLFRMYRRWAEARGFEVEILDIAPGDEAGISNAELRIVGKNAYGFAKAERGVHRLVRISPFDSNARRHTSFCAVDVVAEVDDDVAIEIKDEDLRVDTYRSSGKGGQHVNKTDSAVRLTHLPSGIVVACQNERSQPKNRATAMKMLKARLYEKQQDEKRAAMEKFYGEKGEIGWGNQIRSYVFQPYQLVTDLRTGIKDGNIQQIMDGSLDRFITAWLRAGGPLKRNKDIKIED